MNQWRRIRNYFLPGIAMLGVLFALVTVFARPEEPEKEPLAPPPGAHAPQAVAGLGVIEPKSEVIAIGVELQGVVRKVYVQEGDHVRQGAPLFTLDERESDARITTLQATMEAAGAQVADAAAQYAIVSSIKDARAVAKDDVNQRKFSLRLAQARLRGAEAELQQARINKARLTTTAPIDATVLDINLRAGEYAQAGALATPLMRIGDISRLYVRVEIDEENAARINPSLPAKGYKRGDTQRPIALSFVRVEPYVKPKTNLAIAGQRVDTRVMEVLYALPEGEQGVHAGQRMDVFIEETQ